MGSQDHNKIASCSVPSTDLAPRNIIVRMPNWIGDLVMATPILSDLRKAFPQARITAMCRSPICELLKEDPEIDELFCFSKMSGFGRRSEKRSVIEKLRQGKFDLGILLTHSFSSAWWFWQGKVARRVGYDCNGRKLLLTDSMPLPNEIQKQHLVVTYKMLLELVGIPISDAAPRLYMAAKEIDEAKSLLRQHICQNLPPRVVNLAGLTSLRQLASLVSLCDVLLTNDSGPMHIADAMGTPMVALFGSTSEVVTGPYRSSGIVIHKHVDCSPCYQRTCPIDFRCMKQIEADEVYGAIQKVIAPKRSKLHITAS
jgi:heptosyltransferase-2